MRPTTSPSSTSSSTATLPKSARAPTESETSSSSPTSTYPSLTQFRTYQNSEVKALYHKGQSDWAVFDGRKNANFLPVTKSKPTNVTLTNGDKEAIKNLRNWAETFFAQNTSSIDSAVKNMNWFARDETQEPKEGAVLEVKDVDLVAKLLCDVTYLVDNKLYHKLAFADDERNLYYAEYAGHFDHVSEGDVVKLRSIIM